MTQGYSGTPLPRKLGIKPGMRIALLGAPAGFEDGLDDAGGLPEGATVRRRGQGADLTLWFVRRAADLRRGAATRAAACGSGGLWIAWPKQASGVATDVNREEVRRVGLGAGLVDIKVCAIDETWSGLKFTRRRN